MYQQNFRPYPKYYGASLPTYNYRSGNKDNDRSLLLPFLVGAAVAFPIGYIASNTNKPGYAMPYPQQMQYGYPYGYPLMPQQPYYYYG